MPLNVSQGLQMSFTSNYRVSNSKPVKANADMDVLIANAEYLLTNTASLSLCRIAASQNVPTVTNQVVTFTNPAILDTDSYFSNGTPTRLTIPSGFNRCQFVIIYSWSSSVLGGDVYLQKNGAAFYGRIDYNINGQQWGAARSPILSVTAGDYFEMAAYQNSGGTVNLKAEVHIQGWRS